MKSKRSNKPEGRTPEGGTRPQEQNVQAEPSGLKFQTNLLTTK